MVQYANTEFEIPSVRVTGKLYTENLALEKIAEFASEISLDIPNNNPELSEYLFSKNVEGVINNQLLDIRVVYLDLNRWNKLVTTEDTDLLIYNDLGLEIEPSNNININSIDLNVTLSSTQIEFLYEPPKILFYDYEKNNVHFTSSSDQIFLLFPIIKLSLVESANQYWTYYAYYYQDKSQLSEYDKLIELQENIDSLDTNIINFWLDYDANNYISIDYPLLGYLYRLDESQFNEIDDYIPIISPFIVVFEIFIIILIQAILQTQYNIFDLLILRGFPQNKIYRSLWIRFAIYPLIIPTVLLLSTRLFNFINPIRYSYILQVSFSWLGLYFLTISYLIVRDKRLRQKSKTPKIQSFTIPHPLHAIFKQIPKIIFLAILAIASFAFFFGDRAYLLKGDLNNIPLIWKLIALTIILCSLLLLVYYFKRQTRPQLGNISNMILKHHFKPRLMFLLVFILFFAQSTVISMEMQTQNNNLLSSYVGLESPYMLSFDSLNSYLVPELDFSQLKNYNFSTIIIRRYIEITTDTGTDSGSAILVNASEIQDEIVSLKLQEDQFFIPYPLFGILEPIGTFNITDLNQNVIINSSMFSPLTFSPHVIEKTRSNFMLASFDFWQGLGFPLNITQSGIDVTISFTDNEILSSDRIIKRVSRDLKIPATAFRLFIREINYRIYYDNLQNELLDLQYITSFFISFLSMILINLSLFRDRKLIQELSILLNRYKTINIKNTIHLSILGSLLISSLIGLLSGFIFTFILLSGYRSLFFNSLELPAYFSINGILQFSVILIITQAIIGGIFILSTKFSQEESR